MTCSAAGAPRRPGPALIAGLASPAFVIFCSSNVVNAGNLAFNMLFSRWMGPEIFAELAILLTIKLAVLGVLGAVQMAVSQRVAAETGAERIRAEQALVGLSRSLFRTVWFLLPLAAAVLWWGSVADRLDLSSPWLLAILFAALPFAGPLCLARGVITGRLDAWPLVLSANVEMGIRLLGAVLAWQAGLGLEGVTAAVCISLVAGWAVLRGALPTPVRDEAKTAGLARALAAAAFPFALLQLGQVFLLDADVVIAKAVLGATEAGYVAVLSLFQRIQFFACFGLAAILLPGVAGAVARGGSVGCAARPVGLLFLAVSAVVLAGALQVPALLLDAMAGPAFVAAAPLLWLAGAASVAFTFSYLAATFLAALGDRSGIWSIAFAVPLQLFAMFAAGTGNNSGLAALLGAKLACQVGLAIFLMALVVRRLTRDRTPPLPARPGAV